MKILSYCLFEPKTLPMHRTWDPHLLNQERYWFNIPAVLLINKILYPSHITSIAISPNIQNHPLFEGVLKLKTLNSFELKIIEEDYNLTEPTLWRMRFLWDDIEVFHTRDLDSIPTESEFKYTTAFELEDFGVGTLRTHENHYGYASKMLAGLSSFKPPLVPQHIKGDSFLSYQQQSHKNYGCDQDLMISVFTRNPEYTKDNFFDCKAHRQHHDQDFPCVRCVKENLNQIVVPPEAALIFKKIKSLGFDNWAGEPIDARGDFTSFLLSFFPHLKELFMEVPLLKQFYLK